MENTRSKRSPAASRAASTWPRPTRTDLAAKRAQRAIELVDGVDVVELGNLLLGEAERAIVVAQIVDESDTHQRFSALAVRSAPTVPSGSV